MIAERVDLETRTALSKSILNTFEYCQTEAWHKLNNPLPFLANEPVVFGSAVDRGVELYISAARAGIAEDVVDLDLRAMDAALEAIGSYDDVGVDPALVRQALIRFKTDVIPALDWAAARTQVHLNIELDQLGECDGHPDIILADNRVLDVKTGGKHKPTARTLELGFYALLQEAVSGEPVPSVSYVSYARSLTKPIWRIVTEQVTDEFRRWAYEGAAAFVRAKKADEILNRKAEVPANYSFAGGPSWAGKCAGCAYSPANGGPCNRAFIEETA